MSPQNADGRDEERAESTQNANSAAPAQRVDPTAGTSPLLSSQAARFWIIALVVFLSFLALFLHALHKSNKSSDPGVLPLQDPEVSLIQMI